MGLGDGSHGLHRRLLVHLDPPVVLCAIRLQQPGAGGFMDDLVYVALETVGVHPVGVFSPEGPVKKPLVPAPCCFYLAASVLLLLSGISVCKWNARFFSQA